MSPINAYNRWQPMYRTACGSFAAFGYYGTTDDLVTRDLINANTHIGRVGNVTITCSLDIYARFIDAIERRWKRKVGPEDMNVFGAEVYPSRLLRSDVLEFRDEYKRLLFYQTGWMS